MSDFRVYFERQGADRLCGVHCLNALCQGPVFTQVDLNKYAAELDKEESALLASAGGAPKPPRSMTISSLSNRPKSDNVDETGYFSLGVLEKALGSRFGIHVQNAARKEVIQQINRHGLDDHDGFVIHLRDHWFAARAVNREWFFLDSLKSGPVPVSENELWGTLQGIIQSGGHVFMLTPGKLPQPPNPKQTVLRANQFLLTREEVKKRLTMDPAAASAEADGLSTQSFLQHSRKTNAPTDWNSLGQGQSLTAASNGSARERAPEEEDEDLKRAIAESIKDAMQSVEPPKPEPPQSSSTVTILVRLPSGSRQVRRFHLEEDTVGEIFKWIAFAVPALAGQEVTLAGTMDRKGWKLTKGVSGDIWFTPSTGEEKFSVNANSSLSVVGISSSTQEAFNLI